MSFGLNDVYVIEGETDATALEQFQSLQRAINSGSAWSMQGSYGRAMMGALDAGNCLLGRNAARDYYYGNRIPGRDEVEAGTKGSYDFVVAHRGAEWAGIMRDLT